MQLQNGNDVAEATAWRDELERILASASFAGVQGAMHDDGADVEPFCRAGEIAGLHEGQEDLELAEGDLFVDAEEHGRPADEIQS